MLSLITSSGMEARQLSQTCGCRTGISAKATSWQIAGSPLTDVKDAVASGLTGGLLRNGKLGRCGDRVIERLSISIGTQ